ncbi:RNA export factor gle2 [Bonamia ostreae]|uniref:RNA export factor gle2 n=1 Tax=Bonamia ostreae TaxID=126728 RepID=A0ABV2AF24_9EUKA
MYNYGNKATDNTDTPVPQSPANISSVCISAQNMIAATTWDGQVCVWSDSGTSVQCKTSKKFNAPLLDIDWIGNFAAMASGDKSVLIWDPSSNQHKELGKVLPSRLARRTGSQTLRAEAASEYGRKRKLGRHSPLLGHEVCSLTRRKEGEAMKCNVNERVYAMDSKSFVLAVGTAEKGLLVFDTRNPSNPVKTFASPLRLQTSCVSVFSELDGVCVGSIEGRISVKYFQNDKFSVKLSASFNFKAHREKTQNNQGELATSVNAIEFHPKAKMFVSGGSDGNIALWDKAAKQRVKFFAKVPEAITDIAFNENGSLMAYAMSYDYSQGKNAKNNPSSAVYLKRVTEKDFTAK